MEMEKHDLTRSLISERKSITESAPAEARAQTPTEICWVCLDETKDEPLLGNLCFCTHRQVHKSCLEKWYHYSSERQAGLPSTCPACKSIYTIDLKPDPLPTILAEGNNDLENPPGDTYQLNRCVSLQWRVVILLIGICAGVVCKSFADQQSILFQNIQIYTAAVYNTFIAIFWIFASSEEQQHGRTFTVRVYHLDVLLLCATYLCFLLGCALTTMVSAAYPSEQNRNIALTVHAMNFFTCMLLVGGRWIFVVES